MVYLFLGVIVATVLWAASNGGSRWGLWLGWAVGIYLCSSGPKTDLPFVGAITGQVITVVAISLTLLMDSRSGPYPALTITVCDIAVALTYLSYNLTYFNSGAYSPVYLFSLSMVYPVPYLIGRLYLRTERDLAGALRPLCVALTILVGVMFVQSVTSVDLIDVIARGSTGSTERRHGFYRASGVMRHPDGAGLLLLVSFPLAVAAVHLARFRLGPSWWKWMPWVVALGIVSTNARGAWFGLLIACTIYQFSTRRSLRVPIAAISTAALTVILLAPDIAMSLLYAIGGDTSDKYGEGGRILEINGMDEIYTGTDHRWLLYKVYAVPLRNAGLFGYGLTDGFGFGKLLDDHLQTHFWSIDNYYIFLQLQFGHVAIALFSIMVASAVIPLIRFAWGQRDPITGPVAGAVIGSIIGCTVLLWSVTLLNDMRVPWMFSVGLAVSLAQILRKTSYANSLNVDSSRNRAAQQRTDLLGDRIRAGRMFPVDRVSPTQERLNSF